jgi:flagellar motility protein MotE (MotC chaperone)
MKNGYDQFFNKARAAKVLKKTKPKPPFPWRAVGGLAVILFLAGFCAGYPDLIDRLFSKNGFRVSMAADAATEAGQGRPQPDGAKNPVAAEKPAKSGEDEANQYGKLKQRKEELDQREKELSELEEELQRQKTDLDKRITQLEQMRDQIAQTLKERVAVDQEKVTKLVDLYSSMKPKQAAEVLGTLDEELAVEVLAKMKKRSAAEIMNLLPPEKARVLSEKYTGYRRGST